MANQLVSLVYRGGVQDENDVDGYSEFTKRVSFGKQLKPKALSGKKYIDILNHRGDKNCRRRLPQDLLS